MNEQTSFVSEETTIVENYEFKPNPIKGFPELHWRGKRPFTSTQYFPAQHIETHGKSVDDWFNKIYWGDNLQVMSHLLKEFRGKVDLIYIDPPFDSKADYKKKIELKGRTLTNDKNSFEEKQYGDLWTNDEYLQFMYERLTLMRELLSDEGSIYIHCDYRKSHQIRNILDEIFGQDNFLNSIVWEFTTRSSIKTSWKRTHHDVLFYKKSALPVYNWDDEMVIEPLSENTIKKYKYEDDIGRYRLNGRFLKDSPVKGSKDVDPKWEKTNPELVVRDYLRKGKVAGDCFFIEIENQVSKNRTNYPTQKPEELLHKLISSSSKPGGIIFDCFMGSGTTQAVAMKLGRKFIGADINMGAIQTTTKRLLNVSKKIEEKQAQVTTDDKESNTYFSGFEVFNVNNYDVFRNPVQAREILIEALEIEPYPQSNLYDGIKDGRLVKILPKDLNCIATRADLNELIGNFNYNEFEKKKQQDPNEPVVRLLLVCMGHEPELKAHRLSEMKEYKVDVEVVDILKDKADLEFKRESEASIVIKDGKLSIDKFYPMSLLQKLSLQKENVEDWREMVESVMIDWNYDGAVFEPSLSDIPGKKEFVKGEYDVPEDAGTIKVKIVDLLSETCIQEIQNG